MRDIELGLVPTDMIDMLLEETQEKPWVCPAILLTAWNAFWQIRSTLVYENPINHTHLAAYSGFAPLTYEQVNTVLKFDQTWYQHKERPK